MSPAAPARSICAEIRACAGAGGVPSRGLVGGAVAGGRGGGGRRRSLGNLGCRRGPCLSNIEKMVAAVAVCPAAWARRRDSAPGRPGSDGRWVVAAGGGGRKSAHEIRIWRKLHLRRSHHMRRPGPYGRRSHHVRKPHVWKSHGPRSHHVRRSYGRSSHPARSCA